MSFTGPPGVRVGVEVAEEAVARAARLPQRPASARHQQRRRQRCVGPGLGGARLRGRPAPTDAAGAAVERPWCLEEERARDTARGGFQGALPLGPSAGGMAGVLE